MCMRASSARDYAAFKFSSKSCLKHLDAWKSQVNPFNLKNEWKIISRIMYLFVIFPRRYFGETDLKIDSIIILILNKLFTLTYLICKLTLGHSSFGICAPPPPDV